MARAKGRKSKFSYKGGRASSGANVGRNISRSASGSFAHRSFAPNVRSYPVNVKYSSRSRTLSSMPFQQTFIPVPSNAMISMSADVPAIQPSPWYPLYQFLVNYFTERRSRGVM